MTCQFRRICVAILDSRLSENPAYLLVLTVDSPSLKRCHEVGNFPVQVRLRGIEMGEREYKKLEGMELEIISGVLQEKPSERAIGYSVTFKASLDFLHFKHMANQYVSGYLDSPINAIRPELDGLAYHNDYNYFSDAAGTINDNAALIKVFASPDNYMDQWSSGGLEQRYGKPEFKVVEGQLYITASKDFRWEDQARQIEIADLPVIPFQWALNLMEGHMAHDPDRAPGTKVVLMYANNDLVEVEGLQLFRGMRYMIGKTLRFGPIPPGLILTAG